jgi:hypothetical protein
MAGLAVLLYGVAGCTQGPQYYPVSDTVTLDGKQLEHGDIFFVDISDRYGPNPGKIKAGQFHFKAKAGKKPWRSPPPRSFLAAPRVPVASLCRRSSSHPSTTHSRS